jgi:Cu+-exporting ATPase
LAAEILEGMTVSRGREAIGDLLRYLPRTALVRRGAQIQEIIAEQLVVGDAVLVNPGALVPVDGVVLSGDSFVDEASHYRRIRSRKKNARRKGPCGNAQPEWSARNPY